jgi:hypothetical protein
MPIIPATQEAKIRRITFQVQPRQKVRKISISTSKLGMVVHAYDPSYIRGICRRFTVQGWPWRKKYKTPSEK